MFSKYTKDFLSKKKIFSEKIALKQKIMFILTQRKLAVQGQIVIPVFSFNLDGGDLRLVLF